MSRVLDPGMWRRAFRYITDVSKERTASLFRVEDVLRKHSAA
jgi:hypothetical protein